MVLRLSSTVHAHLLAQAQAAWPEECCGLLLGQGLDLAEARPCANVAQDRRRRFEIDPAALIAAERGARQGGASVIGYYHSHPDGGAQPSLTDAQQAAGDGRLWLIIAGLAITAWVNRHGGSLHGAFDAVAVEII